MKPIVITVARGFGTGGRNYWTNPVNYDLTLNSGRWSIDQCVELVVQALQIKFGDDCKSAFPSL